MNLRCSTFHTNISPRAAFNLNNSGPLQFVGKAFSQCSSEITAEFALPRLLRPNNWKNMHNTHTQRGLDNPFRLMLPFCNVNQHRTNIPFSYTGCCILKTQKGPLQNQATAFQHYNIHFKKSLSVHNGSNGNHLLSSIITRPHTTRFSGACICHLISYCQKTILFTFFVVYTKKSLQTTLSLFLD